MKQYLGPYLCLECDLTFAKSYNANTAMFNHWMSSPDHGSFEEMLYLDGATKTVLNVKGRRIIDAEIRDQDHCGGK